MRISIDVDLPKCLASEVAALPVDMPSRALGYLIGQPDLANLVEELLPGREAERPTVVAKQLDPGLSDDDLCDLGFLFDIVLLPWRSFERFGLAHLLSRPQIKRLRRKSRQGRSYIIGISGGGFSEPNVAERRYRFDREWDGSDWVPKEIFDPRPARIYAT